MTDILLEIGTEEIPSIYLEATLKNFQESAIRLFQENRINFSELKIFGTPRRLVLHGIGLAEKQESRKNKIIGPGINQPAKAVEGFARSHGVSIENLVKEIQKSGERYVVIKEEIGQESEKILPTLFLQLISGLKFPKSMRWGNGSFRFVRPIRWLLGLWDNRVIDLEIEGIRSSNLSYGHRFMAGAEFTVNGPKDYFENLKKKFVIIDPDLRKKEIIKQLEEISQKRKAWYIKDETLLQWVTHLTEFPVAVEGDFKSEYLSLPPEVLISVMKKHQRFFPLFGDQERKNLVAHFVGISNTKVDNPEVIRAGYQRVINARFADAQFLFSEDKKNSLEKFIEQLKGIIFQEKLGTLFAKAERIAALTDYLCGLINPELKEKAKRTAFLCKADLTSQMVFEFPELQGIMGQEYARLSGESEEVCTAIFEHYLPRNVADILPQNDLGAIISIADKIDTITGCFIQGLIPTGSEDPYALRRQCLGIINIIISRKHVFSLSELLDKAGAIFQLTNADFKLPVLEFFQERLKNQCVSEGYAYDFVDAVLSCSIDQPYYCLQKINALKEFKGDPDFISLVTGLKRVVNILPHDFNKTMINSSLFEDEAEKKLYDSYLNLKEDVLVLIRENKYLQALKKMTNFREPVDDFFDTVLVMTDNQELRQNRFALLKEISNLFSEIADFKKIVV